MNLKYSGLLFVLTVLFEAINAGLVANGTSVAKATTEAPAAAHPATDKPLPDNANAEVPKPIDVAPKVKTTTTTSTTTVPPSTTAPPSTEAPVTVSVDPSPSPAPEPSPAPAPEKLTWIIRNSTTNMTCIIAEMAMQLNITYPGSAKDQNTALLNITKDAVASGSCDKSSQYMRVNWGPGHSLLINFQANETAKNFYVSGLSLTVNATVLKDAKVTDNNTIWNFINKSTEFSTPLDMSYKCSKAQKLNLESEDANKKAVLTLSDTQIEAFMNKTKAEFGAAQDCDAIDTPDIVPIAVGCALAILVLVVLVAYLIGRKRSQNRGYLSM